MEPDHALQAAVDNLYLSFEAYPLHPDTGACSCCHNPIEEQRLHQKPLRKLTAKDLEKYAFGALLTWGDVEDFKHFLPRIFELAILHHDTFIDPQVICAKLRYGDWRSWPLAEQQSIESFLQVLWNFLLETEPQPATSGWLIEDWLCGFAQAGNSPASYLHRLLRAETDNARLNLAAFIAETDFTNPIPSDGYWGEVKDFYGEVVEWVRSDAVKTKVRKIADDFPQHGFVEQAYISLP
jgi:hypothetical protein